MGIVLLLFVWGKVILFLIVAVAVLLSIKDLSQVWEKEAKPSLGECLLVFLKNLLYTVFITVGIAVVLFVLLLLVSP